MSRYLGPSTRLSRREGVNLMLKPIRDLSGKMPLEREYTALVDARPASSLPPALVEVRWQLEELRVATFAQPLVTKRAGKPPISAKRIAAVIAAAR